MSFFQNIKNKLTKTRQQLTSGLSQLFTGHSVVDAEFLKKLERQLIAADVGLPVTQSIIQDLKKQFAHQKLKTEVEVLESVKAHLVSLLASVEQPLMMTAEHKPFVILMVGVNGSGKTTTIGKLAQRFKTEGKSVMLAAGDTFRAAAVDQLQVWGERNHVPVISQQTGADSAAVIFDALQSAKAKQMDVLIADTAGRLHTQTHLMDELKKIKRVMTKLDPSAPHEVLLVIDAHNGQNALQQAKQFQEAVGVTGIAVTKLDGTAKGGILFAIAQTFHLPIRFVGMGEQIDDLYPFEAKSFVDALFEA